MTPVHPPPSAQPAPHTSGLRHPQKPLPHRRQLATCCQASEEAMTPIHPPPSAQPAPHTSGLRHPQKPLFLSSPPHLPPFPSPHRRPHSLRRQIKVATMPRAQVGTTFLVHR